MNAVALLILPTLVAQLLVAAGLIGLLKSVLLGVLAILNGILAILATLAVWKSYLLTGVKVALTAMVVIPVVGIVAYFVWANKKVNAAS